MNNKLADNNLKTKKVLKHNTNNFKLQKIHEKLNFIKKDNFLKVYFDFFKSSLVFILFSLFNGILPIVICLFASMVKPFGTQYTMAIGYITAIQLGFLQLGWTIILTLIYSFKRYKNQFKSYEYDKNEFLSMTLFISVIYSCCAAILFLASSLLYNRFASNHLNTILGQEQAYYFTYMAWIFIVFSSLTSTIIINLQVFKGWAYACLMQIIYMGLSVLFMYVFTLLIPISNPNNTTIYKHSYMGLFLGLGLSVGSIISFIIGYVGLYFLIRFKLIKISNFKFKLKFHIKNSWKTLLVILTIQIMKAVCLIGIGLGLADSVDGLVPLSYQMTRVIWYNVLYMLPFLGYGLADAIYFYGFSRHVYYDDMNKIIIISAIGLLIFYIPFATGIYYSIDPLINIYLKNINTNLMLDNNLINLDAVNLEYLMNTMLKKPEYLHAVESLADPSLLKTNLQNILYKPTNTSNPLVNKVNAFFNKNVADPIINKLISTLPPYFAKVANPSTRAEAIASLVSTLNKSPELTLAVKKLFFVIVQNTNASKTGTLILLPDSYAYLFLVSWCIWYPMGLMFFKGMLVLNHRDIDIKEMCMNLLAQAVVISTIVAFGVKLQYSQEFWMYNAWSFPLFITSFLAIIYYFGMYYVTYNKLRNEENISLINVIDAKQQKAHKKH